MIQNYTDLKYDFFELLIGDSNESYMVIDVNDDVIIHQNLACSQLLSFIWGNSNEEFFQKNLSYQSSQDVKKGRLVFRTVPQLYFKARHVDLVYQDRLIRIIKIERPELVQKQLSQNSFYELILLTDQKGKVHWSIPDVFDAIKSDILNQYHSKKKSKQFDHDDENSELVFKRWDQKTGEFVLYKVLPVSDLQNNFVCVAILQHIESLAVQGKDLNTDSTTVAQKPIPELKLASKWSQDLQYLQSLLGSSTSYIIRTDLAGKYTYVNELFCEVFGYTREQLIGKYFKETVHREDDKVCIEAAHKCLAQPEEIIQVIIRKPDRSGKYLHTEWEFKCISNEYGKPTGIQAMGRDITKRLQAEEELSKAKKLYQNLVDHLPILVFKADYHTLQPNFVSPAVEQILGFSPDEWIKNYGAYNQIYLEDLDQVKIKLTEAISTEKPTSIEYRSLHKNGSYKWIRTIITVVRENSGEQPVILGFGMDIHEEKLAQLQISSYENKVRAFFESSIEPYLLVNADFSIAAINQKAVNFFYWWNRTNPGLGDDLRKHLPYIEKDIFTELILKSLSGQEYAEEIQFTTVNNHKHWYRVRINPAYNSGNQIIGSAIYLKDIKQRKQAELALKESEVRFRNLADSSPVGIWMSDEDHLPVYYNKSWLRNTGREFEKAIGVTWKDILHPEGKDEFVKWVDEQFNLKKEFSMSYRCKVGEEYRWLFDHMVPRTDQDGRFIGFIGASTDITNQVNAIEELKLKQSELNELLKEKDLLIKELHHRVKNNIQVVLGMIYLKSQSISNPNSKAILTDVSQRLRSIALLHERLIQKNPLEKVSVLNYFNNIVDELLMMHGGQLTVEMKIQDEHIPMEKAVTLGLILHELLNNAIKYGKPTHQQPITVQYKQTEGKRQLQVKDQGKGFERTVDTQSETSFGLQLVEILVESLKGKLSILNNNGAHVTIDF